RSVLAFSSCAKRSFNEETSCCTDCCVVLSCAATACCVLSSFEDAFQPNHNPPSAISPSTTMAGSCHAGVSLVSMICSSDIDFVSPSPVRAKIVSFPDPDSVSACAAPLKLCSSLFPLGLVSPCNQITCLQRCTGFAAGALVLVLGKFTHSVVYQPQRHTSMLSSRSCPANFSAP